METQDPGLGCREPRQGHLRPGHSDLLPGAQSLTFSQLLKAHNKMRPFQFKKVCHQSSVTIVLCTAGYSNKVLDSVKTTISDFGIVVFTESRTSWL